MIRPNNPPLDEADLHARRRWPWALPYVVAVGLFTLHRYVPFDGSAEPAGTLVFLTWLLIPSVVPLAAAVVDRSWRLFRLLVASTALTMGAWYIVLLHSTGYHWEHSGLADMSMIFTPILLVYLVGCLAVGALAFAVARRAR